MPNKLVTEHAEKKPATRRHKRLALDIYDALKRRIIESRQLSPGSILSESQLAAEFSCSRTPVREALRLLERENLVIIHHNRGTQVASISLDEVVEAYEVRKLIEPYLAHVAANRVPLSDIEALIRDIKNLGVPFDPPTYQRAAALDDRLHGMVASAGGNRMMVRTVAEARSVIRRAVFFVSREGYSEGQGEHLAILEALRVAGSELAESEMRRHLDNSKRRLLVGPLAYAGSSEESAG